MSGHVRKILTIGIGDGGNEIGMGRFVDVIEKNLAIPPSIIETDYTLLATTSNWGAYGFITALESLSGVPLLPSLEEVTHFLDHIVRLGAVDGVLGKSSRTVDGLDWSTEGEILRQLKDWIQQQN